MNNNKYTTPYIEFVEVKEEIITTSYNIPEFGEDDNELPKQDW